MKFVTLRRKRVHQYLEIQSPLVTGESLSKVCGVHHQAHTYFELRQQIHDDLRTQHPEWIQVDGESPMCDAYEARLLELLGPLMRNVDDDSIAGHDPAREHGLN